MPNEQEYSNAEHNLKKNNFEVDYVVTHCAATSVQNVIASTYESNKLTDFFESIKNKLIFKKWFFGHYHKDIVLDERFTAVFDKIYMI